MVMDRISRDTRNEDAGPSKMNKRVTPGIRTYPERVVKVIDAK